MKSIFYVTASLLVLFLQLPDAKASVGTRGGGNVNAAEFSEVADRAITKISILSPVFIHGFEIDGSKMRAVFNKSKIFAVSTPLKLSGKPVNAINNPAKLEIVFNEIAWQKLSPEEKTQLVIHEYIGLTFAEISDLNYSYSSQLLELIQSNASEDLKVHCNLTAFNQNAPEHYGVVDDLMTWVADGGSATKEALADFGVLFSLKDSYMQITLTSPQGQVVIDTNQYVGHTLDFESKVLFQTVLDGKSYDSLNLMCEEALGKTP